MITRTKIKRVGSNRKIWKAINYGWNKVNKWIGSDKKLKRQT